MNLKNHPNNLLGSVAVLITTLKPVWNTNCFSYHCSRVNSTSAKCIIRFSSHSSWREGRIYFQVGWSNFVPNFNRWLVTGATLYTWHSWMKIYNLFWKQEVSFLQDFLSVMYYIQIIIFQMGAYRKLRPQELGNQTWNCQTHV